MLNARVEKEPRSSGSIPDAGALSVCRPVYRSSAFEGLAPHRKDHSVSDLSVTPAVATGTTAALNTDSTAPFHARIEAQMALSELERAVARLERQLLPDPKNWRVSQQHARRAVGSTSI